MVSGPPASGKTTYATRLANDLGALLLDSDLVAERLVRAGLLLAGMDPNDRDSPRYKQAYRDTVYETLFDLAASHLHRGPVVIAGPFTSEGGREEWPAELEARLGRAPELHFVYCPPDERRARVESRGAERDRPKLGAWDSYVSTCREEAPVWPHHWVDGRKLKLVDPGGS